MAGLGEVGHRRGLTLGRVARDPDAVEHTPPGPGRRALWRRGDPGSDTHRVQVLGVRSVVSVSGDRDERIAAVAAHQRGRIARRQLEAIGISSSSVAWRLSRGRLFPSLRGVFVVGHTAPVELGPETEALLAVRPGAALSHWSAAALLGLWVPAPREIEVVVDIWDGAASPNVKVHRSRILQSRDVWIRQGLPVTSPSRTLLDIAASASDRQLEVAFDRGITERTLRLSHVRDLLSRVGGHRGRARLADLLDREQGASTMTRSDGEERMLALMRQAGLPIPRVNFPFGVWELDFYWPEARFVVEVDGHTYHSSRYRFERDRRKDNELRRADIEVMRIVGREIKERSHGLVADVTRALTRRGV
jgi:very-short-patch-repair endonuclease/predicted transcriptional regulator of viral defense system